MHWLPSLDVSSAYGAIERDSFFVNDRNLLEEGANNGDTKPFDKEVHFAVVPEFFDILR